MEQKKFQISQVSLVRTILAIANFGRTGVFVGLFVAFAGVSYQLFPVQMTGLTSIALSTMLLLLSERVVSYLSKRETPPSWLN